MLQKDLRDNYIFVYLEEVNASLTSGCYVLLVWLDFKCGKYKTDGNLSFLQILVDQIRCLKLSYYGSDFPTDGFNSASSIDMEILIIEATLIYVMHLFLLFMLHFWCCG